MELNEADPGSFSAAAQRFAALHAGQPTRPFIGNLETEVALLRHGALALPCTVNRDEPDNAWVCSPLAAYGSYATEEIGRAMPGLLAWPLQALCRAARAVLALARLDQAVAVNNWMLSTNLYPPLPRDALAALVDQARQRWPDHAVWFRSLNLEHNAALIHDLQQLGFVLLPSRQVYLYENLAQARHANLRRDLRLLEKTPLAVHGAFGPGDFTRCETLYRYLYLDKYSQLNPHYSAGFLQRWHNAGLLRFWGLRDGDALQAVVATFRQGDTITAPIVGYNTALPQSMGLYRLLMAHVFDTALKERLRINLSAGAARFKRLRGGRAALEYSAVLTDHLPAPRRAALRALRTLATGIGVPAMRWVER